VLDLLTETRRRFDLRLAALGPDLIDPDFDADRYLRRLRDDDPTRGIGDALLDQRIVAGIGNVWKSEACFAAAVNPWRPLGRVQEQEALAIVDFAHERMTRSAEGDGFSTRPRAVYKRAGLPCKRCGATIRSHGQGDDNRTTYWCPGCQL
jgi:endonuclease-8